MHRSRWPLLRATRAPSRIRSRLAPCQPRLTRRRSTRLRPPPPGSSLRAPCVLTRAALPPPRVQLSHRRPPPAPHVVSPNGLMPRPAPQLTPATCDTPGRTPTSPELLRTRAHPLPRRRVTPALSARARRPRHRAGRPLVAKHAHFPHPPIQSARSYPSAKLFLALVRLPYRQFACGFSLSPINAICRGRGPAFFPPRAARPRVLVQALQLRAGCPARNRKFVPPRSLQLLTTPTLSDPPAARLSHQRL